ncbi:MAG: BON domain-containing protein, partial [Planctomycetota bacterium]
QVIRNYTRVVQSNSRAVRLSGVQVQMQDGTAIMTGTVATERDRRMSQLLMRLEPGVRRVDNRVRLQP